MGQRAREAFLDYVFFFCSCTIVHVRISPLLYCRHTDVGTVKSHFCGLFTVRRICTDCVVVFVVAVVVPLQQTAFSMHISMVLVCFSQFKWGRYFECFTVYMLFFHTAFVREYVRINENSSALFASHCCCCCYCECDCYCCFCYCCCCSCCVRPIFMV